jgi:hypothetical protein
MQKTIQKTINEKYLILGLILFYALLSGIILAAPQVYNRVYVVDLLSYVDGFKRLSEGQIPHVDFNSPTGPLNYYGPYAMIKLGLATPLGAIRAFSLAMAGFGLGVLLYLYATRLTLFGFVTLFFIVVFTMMAQVNLGDDARHVTSTMFYNRLSFGLVALLPFFFFESRKNWRIVDFVLLILIVLILFLLKLTFAFVALALLGVYALVKKGNFLISLAAFVVLLLILTLLNGYHGLIAAYIKDIRDTIGSSTLRANDLFYFILESLGLSLSCIALPLIILFLYKQLKIIDIIIAVFCLSAGIMLTLSSAQWANIYLPLIYGVYASARMGDKQNLLKGAVIALTLYTSANFVATTYAVVKHSYAKTGDTLYALDYGKAGRLVHYSVKNEKNPLLETPHNGTAQAIINLIDSRQKMADFGLFRQDLPDIYLQTLPFGLRAAQKYCWAEDNVMALDFTNPFPVLLNRPSTGYVLFVQDERVVSDKMNIPFARFFKNATCLLEPKLPHSSQSVKFIKRNFGQELLEKYKYMGENELWRVYRLKS